AGENVYCAEVESAIYDHPGVYEAAVFGVPDERLGEEVACVVQLKAETALSGDDLREFLAGRLAPFKIPSRIAFSGDRLPRNPSGKILKRELREAYFGGRP
ncbi:MAG: AMP-binding enzyme, partial [Mycobacterium sp.]